MDNKIETAKSVIQTLGSVAAATMVARTIINDFLPDELHDYLLSTVRSFFSTRFSSDVTFVINEFNGLESNQIFEAAELYLGSLTKSAPSPLARRIQVSKVESENAIHVAVDEDEDVVDRFEGVKFTWVLQCRHVEGDDNHNMNYPTSKGRTARGYCLTFHKKYWDMAMGKYLTHVLARATVVKQENKTTKLFSVDYWSEEWISINLHHPSTFETLAMDPELKKMIMIDLDRFMGRKEYYRHVGKAWKRGYLLYGPPGTGKSSLIAAMANYLNFDIYDLQLSEVKLDSILRKLLVDTGNRSMIIVEDIDCSVEFKNREGNNNDEDDNDKEQVTFSGLLNFVDGLWSSCGEEMIIIFTTNHKEKLDPALLRPGRMDMHIHMSYCTASGFKVLARNYLGVESHERFEEIEGLIEEAQVTPAEVAEQLIERDELDDAMDGLVEFLRAKIKEKGDLLKDGDNGGIVNESNVQVLERVDDSVE